MLQVETESVFKMRFNELFRIEKKIAINNDIALNKSVLELDNTSP